MEELLLLVNDNPEPPPPPPIPEPPPVVDTSTLEIKTGNPTTEEDKESKR